MLVVLAFVLLKNKTMPAPIVAGAIVAAKVVGPIVAKWGVTKVFTKLSSPKEWNDFDLFLKDSVRAFANDPSMNQKYGWDKEIGSTHPLKLLYKPQGNEYLPVNIAKEYLEHWKKKLEPPKPINGPGIDGYLSIRYGLT